MSGKWSMYDEIIDEIPSDIKVDECIFGLYWTFVRAGDYAGIALTVNDNKSTGLVNEPIIGRSLKDVAAGAKSWDMLRASVGIAACNAFHNSPEKMAKYNIDEGSNGDKAGTGVNIFDEPMESIIGKKVAVVGHFSFVERLLGEKCTLSVLERDPSGNDYLDPACEYILPEQDCVFITGMTLINKTLPRLLELTGNARTILVGPSSTISPVLFSYGINTIAGFYVTDVEKTRNLVCQAAQNEIFRGGRRVTYSK